MLSRIPRKITHPITILYLIIIDITTHDVKNLNAQKVYINQENPKLQSVRNDGKEDEQKKAYPVAR